MSRPLSSCLERGLGVFKGGFERGNAVIKTYQAAPLELSSQSPFNGLDHHPVILIYHGEGISVAGGATSPADPVDISFGGIGDIEVNDMRNP